jgi:hypothetical protein
MSSYSICTLENLLFETTGQCDLVLRRVMGYLSGAEIVTIKAALSQEWREECREEDAYMSELDNDFHPYELDDDYE